MTKTEFLNKWGDRKGFALDLSLMLQAEQKAVNLRNHELQKAARALLDKLNRSWVGKDYAEYAFSEDANSHPMADLEKLLTEKWIPVDQYNPPDRDESPQPPGYRAGFGP